MDNQAQNNGKQLADPLKKPVSKGAPAVGKSDAAAPQKQKNKRKAPQSSDDPRRIILAGLVVIAVFFGGLLGWAALAKISGAVIASGTVKVEAERKTVQHLEGGIVESILVKEGDTVEAGQPLVRLEGSQVNAAVDLARKERDKDLAAQARYRAEQRFAKSITWPKVLLENKDNPTIQDVMVGEEKLFRARNESFTGQISLYKNQIDQIKQQIVGFEEQIRSEGDIIKSLKEEHKAKQELYEGRYLEKSQLLQLERELATHQGQRGRLVQAVAESKQKMGELALRISDLHNRWIEEATNSLSKLEPEIFQLTDKLRPLEDAQKRLVITAPVSGKIVDLKIHSKGGVIRPGEPLMDVVPENKPLLIEAKVPVNKIADIHLDQDATVHLEAFDRRTTPPVAGKVVYISADSLEAKTAQGSLPYYAVYVQVQDEDLKKANAYLYPGMPVTVFLTTQERSVLALIVEPLEKNFERSMRN